MSCSRLDQHVELKYADRKGREDIARHYLSKLVLTLPDDDISMTPQSLTFGGVTTELVPVGASVLDVFSSRLADMTHGNQLIITIHLMNDECVNSSVNVVVALHCVVIRLVKCGNSGCVS